MKWQYMSPRQKIMQNFQQLTSFKPKNWGSVLKMPLKWPKSEQNGQKSPKIGKYSPFTTTSTWLRLLISWKSIDHKGLRKMGVWVVPERHGAIFYCRSKLADFRQFCGGFKEKMPFLDNSHNFQSIFVQLFHFDHFQTHCWPQIKDDKNRVILGLFWPTLFEIDPDDPEWPQNDPRLNQHP